MNITDPVIGNFRTLEPQKKALKRLGIESVQDLIFHFPTRYSDISEIKNIEDLESGEIATIYGKITKPKIKKAFRTNTPMAEAQIEDMTGKIKVVWFNQAYIAKMVHDGQAVSLTGKVTSSKNGMSMSNPEIDNIKTLPIDSHNSLFSKEEREAHGLRYPVYKETRGLTSKWIYHTVGKIFGEGLHKDIVEYIPAEILKKYSLPDIQTALVWIHMPKKESDSTAARKRFAFEEVFFIQLAKAQERKDFIGNKSFKIEINEEELEDFTSRFPFELTDSQKKSVAEVRKDISSPNPMSRLLEGDVGSGKTAVAAVASYATIKQRPDGQDFGNLQVAYMAPTEILASQHFENFIEHFKYTGISVGLITSSGCRKFPSKVASAVGTNNWTSISRNQLLKWIDNGEIPIVIGTHSLIAKSVKFKDLALVIIDEQHRFGTKQRAKLAKKEGFAPHFLSMTATPIPRTLALTVYGDLDLTLLDQMPLGRKPIITDIVVPTKRDKVYEDIKEIMKEGRQLYIICPRIDEPDPDKKRSLQMKSVVVEAARLKKDIFPDKEIEILHSKMTKQKKDAAMERFSNGEADILVATSVIEVGVNVPNATMIIIEGAERFGLAQLHQLRGRVVRSTHQAYCYAFSESGTAKTADRLKAFKTAKNGFELSEMDLELRGAGELTGAKQWGISDLGMEAIKNLKMVEAARKEAQAIIEKGTLKNYPTLEKQMIEKNLQLHFE
ncbi:MAG: ATP-dependent DNA helicase RecG [Candidatus Paceibacteria bacterium]|jgi:ATP-dependent DNA helicase RecG